MKVSYSIGVRVAGGGIGNTAYQAVRGLQRHGLLYRLLCGSYRKTGPPVGQVHTLGLASRVLRRAALLDSTRWLSMLHDRLYDRWAAQRLGEPDLFHGWGGFSWLCIQAARQSGAVTVVERASTHPEYQDRILQEEYLRRGLRFYNPKGHLRQQSAELQAADYVLVPSEFARQTFLARGFPPVKLLLVPFGVDTDRFSPAPGDHARGATFRVLFVGAVSLQKGIIDLLEAWKKLGWQDAELLIAGRRDPACAPLLSPYRSMAGVRWLGHVRDPERIYQQADVFAFPTLQEGSALVTYEALACGLPVVTTPNAGSLVREGQEGFLVAPHDLPALAGCLDRLRSNPPRRRAMGQAGRRLAEAYTWEAYGDRLAAALHSCVP